MYPMQTQTHHVHVCQLQPKQDTYDQANNATYTNMLMKGNQQAIEQEANERMQEGECPRRAILIAPAGLPCKGFW